jgi:putative endonuclease
MYYVYILQNSEGKFYKGYTADLKKRIKEHNSGKVKSTKNFKHWKLVYYEAFISKASARKEELFLKTGKGRERIKFLFE